MIAHMPWFMRFVLRPFYGPYIRRHHQLTAEGMERVKDFPGPCIVLGNHATNEDQFLISAFYPYHIRWVAGATIFRNPFLSFILKRLVTSIPKQQGRSDLQTIRDISGAFKQGDIVGMFPEGTRTWDGETAKLDISTAKLIRIFRAPVILVKIEGAYGQRPRWSYHERKGKCIVKLERILTSEEVSALTPLELAQIIQESLDFSYDDWQETHHYSYKSKYQAEGLERLCYVCPTCHSYSTLTTKGTGCRCSTCGTSFTLNEFDRIVTDASFPFTKLREWRLWQREYLSKTAAQSADNLLFPADKGQFLLREEHGKLVELESSFRCEASNTALIITAPSHRYEFKLSEIHSFVINAKQTMEFFYENVLYRIRLNQSSNTLKYKELYEVITHRSNP